MLLEGQPLWSSCLVWIRTLLIEHGSVDRLTTYLLCPDATGGSASMVKLSSVDQEDSAH